MGGQALRDAIEARLSQARSKWLRISQFGAFLLGVLSAFWFLPPFDTDDGYPKALLGLVQFVITVFAVLIVVMASRRSRLKDSTVWWWCLTTATLLGTVVAFFVYYYLL